MRRQRALTRRSVLARAAAAMALLPAVAHGEDSPPPLWQYGKLPTIGAAALSPDGTRAAYVTCRNDTLQINDLDLVSGEITSALIENSNGIPVLIWATNDTVFFATSHTDKMLGVRYESWIGYLLNIRTGKRYRLFSELQDYGANLAGDFHRVHRNGRYYITASNYHVTAANYLIDYSTAVYAFTPGSRSVLIDEDTRRIIAWALTGDGHALARSEYDDSRRLWQIRYKGPKGWNIIYSLTCDLDMPQLCGVGQDGASVLLYFSDGPVKDAYVELRPDGTLGAPMAGNRSTYAPLFSATTNRLIGFSSENGIGDYVFYDPAYATLPAQIKAVTAGQHAALIDMAEYPNQVIIYTEGPENPGSYAVHNFTTGKKISLGETYPTLPRAWMRPKQRISYPATDGLMIEAMLTSPVKGSAKNGPLVVLPHGGPESYDDERFDWMAQALASRGYRVLQPNYRGSAGYGSDFAARGYGEWGRKMQTDLSDGVRYLVAQGLADPARVAIIGASYGGYAALAGIALQSGIYRCAVSVSGMSDMRDFMNDILKAAGFNRNSRNYMYWKRFIGDETGWDAISPINHAAAVTAPVLLIHGKEDTVVAVEQSYRMRDALRQAGKPVEMVLLKDEDHYLSREPTRIQTLEAIMAFLLKTNPPG